MGCLNLYIAEPGEVSVQHAPICRGGGIRDAVRTAIALLAKGCGAAAEDVCV